MGFQAARSKKALEEDQCCPSKFPRVCLHTVRCLAACLLILRTSVCCKVQRRNVDSVDICYRYVAFVLFIRRCYLTNFTTLSIFVFRLPILDSGIAILQDLLLTQSIKLVALTAVRSIILPQLSVFVATALFNSFNG
mmetsp:Transcript_19689/g.50411  ORF Transcript_19689/g.50411 Transcript_19689/m.50411 type:complete len:137 (-) Transcript_19689:1719-2129(-)